MVVGMVAKFAGVASLVLLALLLLRALGGNAVIGGGATGDRRKALGAAAPRALLNSAGTQKKPLRTLGFFGSSAFESLPPLLTQSQPSGVFCAVCPGGQSIGAADAVVALTRPRARNARSDAMSAVIRVRMGLTIL